MATDYLNKAGLTHFWGKIKTALNSKLGNTETAYKTSGIPYGVCDSTSTATAFTATVDGVSELRDGVCMWLKNGVITSASGFTVDINELGAKPVYSSLAAATRETTIFNVAYTMLFVYDETRVTGGCWVVVYGYNSNTNTIGYQLRTNYSTLPAADTGYRYRLWFTSADGTKWVPANTSTATNSTTARTLNTTPINPFGPIVYNSTNGTTSAGSALPTAGIWQQYSFNIGYSYVKTLTFPGQIYLKCEPQTNGSAIMKDIVQTLPSTADGFIYILLGRAYSATSAELISSHPVFYYSDGAVRAWTNAASQTVNDATLTIQKNGSTIQTFSANSSTNKTANITVPTAVSELTNDANYAQIIRVSSIPTTNINDNAIYVVVPVGSSSESERL